MVKPSPHSRLSVNVVGWDNGGGLTTDIGILTGILTEIGCRVQFNGRRIRSPSSLAERIFHGAALRLRQAYVAVRARPVYDVNLFIESIAPKFIPAGRLNCLIPNPEWFREENMPYLSLMDLVLCKTRNAVDIFTPLASDARYLGFTSADRLDPETRRSNALMCLHAAGASPSKGTSAVLRAWYRHPEWPRLVVIRSPSWYGGQPLPEEPEASNIQYVTERLDDHTLKRYQNECEVHICPSEAEGFGHFIVEAMSCGAVVITTDAPPMNELVTENRGVLVRSERAEPMRLGTSYFVDVDDLERQISRVLDMGQNERRAMGRNARQWYETQCKSFEATMKHLVNGIWLGKISG